MTSSDDHRVVRELLGMSALGRLADHEETALRAHLDGCASCRAVLAELRTTAGLLAGVDPDRVDESVPVPADLGDRVLAAVRQEREAGDELAARRRRRVPRWVPAVAAAAVVAVVGAGGGYQLAPRPAAVPLETVALTGPVADGLVVTAGLVPHTWGMEIKLDGTGFTTGADYRVRVLTDSGGRVEAGEFIGVGSTTMRCNLSSSVLRTDAEGFEVVDDTGAVVLSSTF